MSTSLIPDKQGLSKAEVAGFGEASMAGGLAGAQNNRNVAGAPAQENFKKSLNMSNLNSLLKRGILKNEGEHRGVIL